MLVSMSELRGKVIKGLECCGGISSVYECPYQGSEGCDNCRGNIYLDALTMLKLQEPQKAKNIISTAASGIGECPSCGAGLNTAFIPGEKFTKFCYNCGQAVKWYD